MDGLAVRCEGLSKAFGATLAVKDASFTVEEGQLLALLGPSGCGKTTALRLIAGFEAPETGTVEIKKRLVTGPKTFVSPEARRIGMVFQDYALFPHLNVRRNIAYGVPKSPRREELLDWLIELVGLTGLGLRWPHELSGGEQQRVALARALAPQPDVVLLDEPFSNLDTSLRVKIRSEVRRILREVGISAVFVTHDQDEALSLADSVAVMLDGWVVQVDTPEGLYAHPSSLAVAAFLGEANVLDGEAVDGTVQCELGPLPFTGTAQGRVKVLIRPEALRLYQVEEGICEVEEREYFGHDQVVLVRLPSGHLIRCRCGPDVSVNRGDRVDLHVNTPVAVYSDPS